MRFGISEQWFATLSGIAFMLVTNAVGAAAITYTDRSSWSAEVGLHSVVTFEDQAWSGDLGDFFGTDVTIGPLQFSHGATSGRLFGISEAVTYDAAYHTGNYFEWQRRALTDPNVLIITLPEPSTAFGTDFGMFYGEPTNWVITLSTGEVFNRSSPSNAYGFFGVSSDTAFTSVAMRASQFPGIDNISFNRASPLTASLSTLGHSRCSAIRLGFFRHADRRRSG